MSDPLAVTIPALEGEAPTEAPDHKEAMHPASRRRDQLRAIQYRFGFVPVKPGTEQSAAIKAITDDISALAQKIEVRCADGRSKDLALDKLLEAKMLAIHAISHRR